MPEVIHMVGKTQTNGKPLVQTSRRGHVDTQTLYTPPTYVSHALGPGSLRREVFLAVAPGSTPSQPRAVVLACLVRVGLAPPATLQPLRHQLVVVSRRFAFPSILVIP